MRNQVARVLIALVMSLEPLAIWAQVPPADENAGFRTMDPAEERRLRAVIAEPVPQGFLVTDAVLRAHFERKNQATYLLNDVAQRESFLRQAVKLLPDATWRTNLAGLLTYRGEFDEANELGRQAMAAAGYTPAGALYVALDACRMYFQNRDDDVRSKAATAIQMADALESSARSPSARSVLFRARARGSMCLGGVERRLGRFEPAIRAATAAEDFARKSLTPLSQHDSDWVFALSDLRDAIYSRIWAYQAAGQLQSAERSLADLMRLLREPRLPTKTVGEVHDVAANLRFAQREFALAEQLLRRANAAWRAAGSQRERAWQVNSAGVMLLSLAGQSKWAQALRELEELDKAAPQDPALQRREQYAFHRGVVYFGNRRYAEAAAEFADLTDDKPKPYPVNHFFPAEAIGLHGAALWHTGTGEGKVRALQLLKTSVRDYMSSANADFLENVGLRKELREWVFAAYLEAVSGSAGEDGMQALGAADWVRGGVVQDAVINAAARAAASNSAIASLIRREQDAKNEVVGLRRYLSGEAGAAISPVPTVAAQMRARIAALEEERGRLRAEIKARVPDYDSLVHPVAPTAKEIAAHLRPEQALLLLLPTSEAVYVWAVSADRTGAFARIPLSEARLNAMVTQLRRQLDLDSGPDAGVLFNSEVAFELYDKLLAPLSSAWKGKPQLVIASGGVLSQLPFAVLQTRPHSGIGDQAPWLIRDASIAQVPSLSSWLALRTLARAKLAPEPFMGWGDPLFNRARATGPASTDAQMRKVVLARSAPLVNLQASEQVELAPSALNYSDIPPLPDTREELVAIAEALRGDTRQDLLLGADATRESVVRASKSGTLAKKRVIAFATHGLMAGDVPNLDQPALAMAATGREKQEPLAPLLTLEDVLTLNLDADWVVLSACNTAAGAGKSDEALSGLARAFFYAGARSLLVTHWAVESRSAKLLTTATFAHYVANPQAPKADSLRQAMLQLMAMPRFAHPAYWAPFALVGDGAR